MAASYAESGAWLVNALTNLGRNDEARRIGETADALAGKVLERRPGYRMALHAQRVIESVLAGVALNDLEPVDSLRYAQQNITVSEALMNLDPNSTVSANNLGNARQNLGDAYWYDARLKEAMPHYVKSLGDFERATAGGANQTILFGFQTWILADPFITGCIALIIECAGCGPLIQYITRRTILICQPRIDSAGRRA